MKNFTILLINHDHQGRVTMELQANHEVHAARKAEKMIGTGWEAITILH